MRLTLCAPTYECFDFETEAELLAIPAVRCQVESIGEPEAEEVAAYEYDRLRTPTPPTLLRILDFVPPWTVRAESAFVRLVQEDVQVSPGQRVRRCIAERRLIDPVKSRWSADPVVHVVIGHFSDPVPWLPHLSLGTPR